MPNTARPGSSPTGCASPATRSPRGRRHGRGGHTAQRHRTDGAAAGRHGRPAGAGGHRTALRQHGGGPSPAGDGQVPVAHACGHDMHTACLLGAADLLAQGQNHWNGTLVALFQPAEETVDGAQGMVDDGLAQTAAAGGCRSRPTCCAVAAGYVGAQAGPAFAAADCIRVTVYGRGGHASRPETTVDPWCSPRRSCCACRPSSRGRSSRRARRAHGRQPARGHQGQHHRRPRGAGINIRTYSEGVRSAILAAIQRIVTAGMCAASGSPRDPEFEFYEHAR